MRYYATASGPRVRDAMRAGLLGMIATPAVGNRLEPGAQWCADNACFTPGRYPGDGAYLSWLAARRRHAGRCEFATAPDVVADAAATLARSIPMLPQIRTIGYRTALVAQDGLEYLTVPWADIDALFIGGSTGWKLGPAAARLATEARNRGKWVHMGRVNSRRRLQYAAAIGCDSADGTYLAFGPDRNLPRLLEWLADLNRPRTADAASSEADAVPRQVRALAEQSRKGPQPASWTQGRESASPPGSGGSVIVSSSRLS